MLKIPKTSIVAFYLT